MTMRERPLNALEALFASCNVRFALLLVLDGDTNISSSKLEDQAKAAVESSRLGHLELKKKTDDSGGDEWRLVESTDQSLAQVVVIQNNDDDDNYFGKFLDDTIQNKTTVTSPDAEGPLTLQIIESNKNHLSLLVNGNHAMVDGRSLMHLVGVTTNMVEQSPSPLSWKDIVLPDWKDMIEQEQRNEEPPYLVPGQEEQPTLTFGELCTSQDNNNNKPSSKGTTSGSLRWDLAGSTVAAIRQILKQKGEISFSGFLTAVLMNSIATEYNNNNNNNNNNSSDESRYIGISLLVDLRPYLQKFRSDDNTDLNDQQIPQAHGTITLVESTETLLKLDLLRVATGLTRQIKMRIDRGEAHRAALALTNGHFEPAQGGAPPATMELSNLGVCNIPNGTKLYTAQRFDGYDGVSCMMHSEANNNGYMRWNASVGAGLDATLVERVFTRAYEMCLQMAGESL